MPRNSGIIRLPLGNLPNKNIVLHAAKNRVLSADNPKRLINISPESVEPFHRFPEIQSSCADLAFVDVRRWFSEHRGQFPLREIGVDPRLAEHFYQAPVCSVVLRLRAAMGVVNWMSICTSLTLLNGCSQPDRKSVV